MLPDSGSGRHDDRAARSESADRRMCNQRDINFRRRCLGEPGRLLHIQGRLEYGLETLGRKAR